ncbi:MAG: hypothetical protein V3U04_05170 [Candidatus Aerophobetes bacterium]
MCKTFIQMARDFPRSILASFEGHFSPSDIRDMLAVEDGKIRSCGARENCAETPLDKSNKNYILGYHTSYKGCDDVGSKAKNLPKSSDIRGFEYLDL